MTLQGLVAPLKTRWVRFGLSTTAGTLIFLGILVILQIISIRHPFELDVTRNRRYSLSPETMKLLKGLKQEVKAYAFVREQEVRAARDLLKQYQVRSKNFTFLLVDPDRNPGMTKQYAVATYGTVVLETNGKREAIQTPDEEKVTNALARLLETQVKVLYFLEGHGEADPANSQREGYSDLQNALKNENYEVKKLLLMREKKIPQDAIAVVLAGPLKPMLPEEEKILKEYLEGGGKILALLDPEAPDEVVKFFNGVGFKIGKDTIVDKMSRVLGGDYLMPIVSQYESHPITREFRFASFFPTARSVDIQSASKDGKTFQVLAKTSPGSWGETNLDLLKKGKAGFDKQDRPGPVPVAAVCALPVKEKKEGRVVIFGDSDFATNGYLSQSGNRDLILNSIAWLGEKENLISVRPRPAQREPLILTAPQSRLVFLFSVIVLPLAVALVGAVNILRRK